GADPNDVAARLREMLPDDIQVFTRAELADFESEHWITKPSTGLIFGIGVVVAVIVGFVILYQTLSTQITRQLPQYATLKAMGYSDVYLGGIVVWLGLLMAFVAFPPAVAAAMAGYDVIHEATRLPIMMTHTRLAAVA